MKLKLLTTFFAAGIVALIIKDSYSSNNGIAGRTGSTGETTCLTSGCHTGNVLNATGGSIVISSPDLVGFAYTPGQTYTINVTVSRTGVNLYGLAFEALRTTGANAGSFIHTMTTQTWSKSATVSGNSRTAVTHKLNGGVGTGTKTFTFNWVAPATNVGNVTFYAAGNAANGTNTTAGDFIYTATQLVIPNTAGINSQSALLENVSVFPNPVSSVFNVSFSTEEKTPVKIEVYNLAGKFQELLLIKDEMPGNHNYTFNVEHHYASGLYLIKTTAGAKTSVKKVYFQ